MFCRWSFRCVQGLWRYIFQSHGWSGELVWSVKGAFGSQFNEVSLGQGHAASHLGTVPVRGV